MTTNGIHLNLPLGLPNRSGPPQRLVNTVCYRSILRAASNDIRIVDSTNLVTDELDS